MPRAASLAHRRPRRRLHRLRDARARRAEARDAAGARSTRSGDLVAQKARRGGAGGRRAVRPPTSARRTSRSRRCSATTRPPRPRSPRCARRAPATVPRRRVRAHVAARQSAPADRPPQRVVAGRAVAGADRARGDAGRDAPARRDDEGGHGQRRRSRSPPRRSVGAGHDGGYQLQVSSFRTQAEASQFADQLRARGHKAYVVEAHVPGRGTWFRVRVGPFTTQHAAAQLPHVVRGEGARRAVRRAPPGHDRRAALMRELARVDRRVAARGVRALHVVRGASACAGVIACRMWRCKAWSSRTMSRPCGRLAARRSLASATVVRALRRAFDGERAEARSGAVDALTFATSMPRGERSPSAGRGALETLRRA